MKETARNNLIAVRFENLLLEFLPYHSKFTEQFKKKLKYYNSRSVHNINNLLCRCTHCIVYSLKLIMSGHIS